MSDQIETRLYRYFAQLRPNPAMPAEARLVAALDRAAAGRPLARRPGPFFGLRLGGSPRLGALVGAVAVIVALASGFSFAVWSARSGDTVSATALSSASAGSTAGHSPSAGPTTVPTPPPTPVPGYVASGRMVNVRDSAAAVALADGRVLLVGGYGGVLAEAEGNLASAELFDPRTRTFSPTGSMYQRRGAEATATLLRDGRVLVAGGRDAHSAEFGTAGAELYDPATGTFSQTGPMTQPRSLQTATPLQDGRVLIVGGEQHGAEAEVYDPATGRFTAIASPRIFGMVLETVLLDDGRVLVMGQDDAGTQIAELYDPDTRTFAPTGSPVFSPQAATLLSDGRVLAVGTTVGLGHWAEIYDPATGRFTVSGSMTSEAQGWIQTITRLRDGRVLVGLTVGGDPTPMYPVAPIVAQVYDPATGTFASTGLMASFRVEYTATLLQDGRVLFAGGAVNQQGFDTAELYDPATNTFTLVAP